MKYTNKGHEYDDVWQNIAAKKKFYLFGAGDYGKQFVEIIKNEINICGYIDNNSEKWGKMINNFKCYSYEEWERSKEIGIIITMSQIARRDPILQLQNENLVQGVDFFMIEEFLSVYYVYKYDKVYFSTISFLPSTACNLKCRYCLNFNPFSKRFYVRELDALCNDVDLFFSCVDHIMLFHISGGETMLYKDLNRIIEYISKNYGNRIDTLRVVTNGTIVPDDLQLKTLAACNVEVTVDDYRDAVPTYSEQFEELLEKLDDYHVRYYINKVDSWINLAPESTNFFSYSESEMQQHFDKCNQSWQELRDGKLFSCNYAAYAAVAGISDISDEETFDLKNFTDNRKKELVEFRLGYSEKGYTQFCRKCRGFGETNTEIVKAAEQI